MILDVGCWTGGFLATLPSSYVKHGLEPSKWAQGRAVEQGVVILGPSLEEGLVQRGAYDFVTMIDVIEHTTSPLVTLGLAARCLNEDGRLVVTTGNSRALPWRLMPRDYWYYFSEHVCFYSKQWFWWAAKQLNLEVEKVGYFSHFQAASCGTPLFELASVSMRRLLGGDENWPVRLTRRTRLLRGRAETVHWRDHMIVVLRRLSGDGRKRAN